MPTDRLHARLPDGRPVASTWIRSGGTHVALLLPGRGYTAQGPVLHYPGLWFVQHGCDVISVDYVFSEMSYPDMVAHAAACAAAVWATATRSHRCDHVVLVGKSLGTQAMARLIDQTPELRLARCVWLTPIFADNAVMESIEKHKPRSLFVGGTSDATFDSERMERALSATGGSKLVLDGANHSLERPGDVRASLAAISTLLDALERFMTKE